MLSESDEFDICLTRLEVCSYVPRSTRPQRRQPRPCDHVLLQAVQHRAGQRKPGYANFAIAEPPLKLVLLENPGNGGTLNHLGVEVQSSEKVHEEIARLQGEGLFTDEEIGTTCCFATQDKVWVTGPAGERWEVYTVLADSETFGASPQHPDRATGAVACCGGGSPTEGGNEAAVASCC